MEIDKFIEKFAELFDNSDPKNFKESTRFKESEEWSSLIVLYIISMADEEYNVTLKAEDIRNANTIGDLFHLIESKT